MAADNETEQGRPQILNLSIVTEMWNNVAPDS